MDPNQVIIVMILICVAFLLVITFSQPFKYIGKVLVQGAIGSGLIIVVNFFTASLGVAVGINIFTALLIGFMGIPGFISLYILGAILH